MRGQYAYLRAGYFDACLSGCYDAQTAQEQHFLRGLLRSVNAAIAHMQFSRAADAGVLPGEYHRLKALVLIRSAPQRLKPIRAALAQAQRLIYQYAQQNTRLARNFYLTQAWYYTYCEQEAAQVTGFIRQASAITARISPSALATIDEQLIPSANLLLECGQYEQSAALLLCSVAHCTQNHEIAVYRKRKAELLGYLVQVYFDAGQTDRCRTTLAALDALTAHDHTPDPARLVPPQLRAAVYAATRDW